MTSISMTGTRIKVCRVLTCDEYHDDGTSMTSMNDA